MEENRKNQMNDTRPENGELEHGEPGDKNLEERMPGSVEQGLERKLESGGWKDVLRNMKMPQQNREALLKQIKDSRSSKRENRENACLLRARCVRIAAAAACMLFVLATAGMTAHAVYVNHHFDVFFEKDITKEELHRIETQLQQMEGVASCRYIDADTAWKTFGETYLTPEMMEAFEENPLADSASFRVGISLDADAAQMKELIGELEGVRLVSGLWEE